MIIEGAGMRRFSLYRRGKVYYCQFYNPKTKKYLSGRSTGQTNRNSAYLVVQNWIQNGIPTPRSDESARSVSDILNLATLIETLRTIDLSKKDVGRIVDILKQRDLIEGVIDTKNSRDEIFTLFLRRFWSWDQSPYINEKLAHGQQIGERHCYDMQLWRKNYWDPFFSDISLSKIKRSDLVQFSLWLSEKNLKPKTINNILSVGTVALRWASDNELIVSNPAKGLAKFSGHPKKRGVLEQVEAQRLFELDWDDQRARIGNLLAMTTGLRAGEVLGLQVRDIKDDRLHIRHSWSTKEGLKSTKNGEERTIPLLPSVRRQLLRLAADNPHGLGPASFVFWSTRTPEAPMDFHFLLNSLKTMLLKLTLHDPSTVSAEELQQAKLYWRTRNIVFHSWRHYFATHLANRIDLRAVQLATGHRSPNMAAHYANHAQEQDFKLVSNAIEEAFGTIIQFSIPQKEQKESQCEHLTM
ncbi:tyrosine-type recombinase/integrase [Marispirochaeta aestuarii]|nr:tyrosine-type recombinase/integrase [Marispirochaeta aestuarii]